MTGQESMRVIRDGDRVTYLAPGATAPVRSLARRARQTETVRRRLTEDLAALDRSVSAWERTREREAVFRQVVDAGWFLDDEAFALRLAERRREMRAAADRGDAEYFRNLD